MKATKQTDAKRALCERAYGLFQEFRGAYVTEWQRLENCERMYRGDHWHDVPVTDRSEPRPVTPILQSTVENVKAELMDRVPEAVIAPESPADAEIARVIEAIVRQNHDADGYVKEYRKLVHDLLVGGYCVQEVGYDGSLNGGLGGAFVRHVDARSVLFDPLTTDLQESRGIFKISLKTREYIAAHFPKAAPFLTADAFGTPDAVQDVVLHGDRKDAMLFIEYWWREYDDQSDRYSVHMAQIAGNQVLTDSRDVKPDGYFEHGLYPFIVTPLFTRKGSCLGLGLVDMFETQQKYADKLDQIVLKNALMASHNKLLVTEASGFDVDDLRDWSKEVHRGESLSGVTWFSTPPLPAYVIGYIQSIRESIKEESGANDFSRGMSTGGVTAASAISALQEMSNKRARMAARLLHESFRDAVRLEIEVEREFNFFSRRVNVTVDGEVKEYTFESAMLMRRVPGNVCLPIEFFISVKAQQETRYTAMNQNELVLRMLQSGIMKPVQAVELMMFDGKDELLKQLREQSEAQQTEQDKQAAQQSREGQSEQAKQVMTGRNT
ncbi:MAG TPA: hypothetical protein P5075_12285 [Eubacteriales bacterium]|nr:hypothetical protein [Eubacteriales bacterium]